MSRFVMKQDVAIADFDWGSAGMRVDVPSTGCETFVVMDVTLTPGGLPRLPQAPRPGRDDHRQVRAGSCSGSSRSTPELGPGDSVYIDKDVVHGSFNEFDETAELQVILAPAIGRGRLRARRRRRATSPGRRSADAGSARARGRRAPLRDGARPGARARRGRRRAEDGGAEPPRHPRHAWRLPVPAAARARLRRRRRAAGHGRGGADLPRARLGRSRGRLRAGLPDPRRPARRDVRGARGGARGERLPEAGAALVGGGRGAPARRPHRLPGAVRARRAA